MMVPKKYGRVSPGLRSRPSLSGPVQRWRRWKWALPCRVAGTTVPAFVERNASAFQSILHANVSPDYGPSLR